jgi:hypothetical protein
MTFTGNPRKYARDIGEGYVMLSPVMLRGFTVADLRKVKQAVELELRDARGEVAARDDPQAIQARQRRILRLNQALRVIRTFALDRRLSV